MTWRGEEEKNDLHRKILIAAAIVVASGAIGFSVLHWSTRARANDVATATPTQATPAPQPTPTPPPITNSPAAGPGIFSTRCVAPNPHGVRVTFLWGPSRAGPQWLDLSVFNNGFAPGTFVTAGAFNPNTWGFVWDGVLQGTTHYARVNTLMPAGWMPSGTLAFFTPVCDPASYEPAPAPDMLQLRDDVADVIAGSGIDTAVAVTDLQTGETVDVNGNATRLPGCTINLFALIRVVVDLQFGRYPESQLGDTIGQTINRSDPILARQLMRDWIGGGDLYLGMRRVNDFMHSLGMNGTLMDHPPAFSDESLFGGIDNRITARDVNHGLKALWDARLLTPAWRDYMLREMTLVKPGLNYLIPVGTSPGAVVSHKNGFLWSEGWADNDIGIVWFERDGQRYGFAISFFTQGVPQKYADVPMGQQVSSLAYQWFVNRYGYPV